MLVVDHYQDFRPGRDEVPHQPRERVDDAIGLRVPGVGDERQPFRAPPAGFVSVTVIEVAAGSVANVAHVAYGTTR